MNEQLDLRDIIAVLEQQRNEALNTCTGLVAQIKLLERKILAINTPEPVNKTGEPDDSK